MADNRREDSPSLLDYPEETLCPSCGKFVGAYARCPYCGTEHGRRFSIRFFRIFSICMAVGGVFLIWLAARGIEAPLIKIDDIQPTNAFAYVRVKGKVTTTRLYSDGGLSFRINDGTGTLPIRAYADMGRKLREIGRVPAPGDTVSAEGTLQLRQDFVQMIVNVPEKVKILEHIEPETVAVASLDRERIGEKVAVEGRITGARKFNKGSSVTLSDGTGSIQVVIWDSDRRRLGEKEKLLEPGRSVKIAGKVDEYRNRLQLILSLPSDIAGLAREVVLPGARPAPEAGEGFRKLDVEEVSRGRLKETVEITGVVGAVRKFSRGRKFALTDPTGSVEVVVWDSVYGGIPDAEGLIRKGNPITVRGEVGEYRGTLQVVPRSPAYVRKADFGGP